MKYDFTQKRLMQARNYIIVSFLFFNIIFWCMYKSKYHLNLPMNNKSLLVWLHSCSCGSLIGSWSASPEPSWPIWPYSIACERPTSWHQYRSTLSPTLLKDMESEFWNSININSLNLITCYILICQIIVLFKCNDIFVLKLYTQLL